jgi:putative transposase
MYSYEDRLRAVQLYIKLGKRLGLTIRQLGYPAKNALKDWYREYEQRRDLHAVYSREPRCSTAQREQAVQHYLDHGRCIALTIKALGYPSRGLLSSWIRERCPNAAARLVGRPPWHTPSHSTAVNSPLSSRCACGRAARSQWPRRWAYPAHPRTTGRIS